ncbi:MULTISPECIES: sigma-70 family RNA polymerase sigma factor [unclassified Streptomyces]|jgi:RNA polymerase sigma-70 factor (ECF subfamily)|uniref:sigma-70 family RNA polymerase sigma factor n=1 Tax=Actinacidiphila glaucinigra TaxID=235986 RepID=UPI000D0AB48A|nr:sigma-70 family RNA polymerase sigma factor [Streptomyces sp. SID8377]
MCVNEPDRREGGADILAGHDTGDADEHSAVASLIIAERDSLRRFVTGLMGRDVHAAEDVLQETMLRALQRAERLDVHERPVRMWLFRVARNLVVDHRRRDRAVPVGITAADFAGTALEHAGDHAGLVEDRSVLLAALSALAPAHREAVVRVHVMDQTGADAAAELGVPRGTVKSRTHHGVRALRAELARRGVDGVAA